MPQRAVIEQNFDGTFSTPDRFFTATGQVGRGLSHFIAHYPVIFMTAIHFDSSCRMREEKNEATFVHCSGLATGTEVCL